MDILCHLVSPVKTNKLTCFRPTPSPKVEKQPESTNVSNPPVQVEDEAPVQKSESKASREPQCVFDIEDILNFDSLPPLLSVRHFA